MAKNKLAKGQLHQAFQTRPGEGAVIGVVRNKYENGFTLELDFSIAPVPERRFSADGAWVVFGTDMVRVMFAQFKLAGPEVKHVVVLRLPFSGARQFVESMTRGDVAKTAHQLLSKINNAPSPLVDKKALPDQTFTLDANIIIAGVSGREACMDLYHSSPQVKVALLRQGSNEFRAEPVARVTLTTRLLMDIFDELANNVNTFPADEVFAVEVRDD